MPRQPSEATQIRTLRRDLHAAQAEARSLRSQRDNYHAQLVARVNDVKVWEKRFDALLKILPPDGDGERNG